jgi:peptidoglycan/xylan/chitin deacetylase (PgdA/CDA1 family)
MARSVKALRLEITRQTFIGQTLIMKAYKRFILRLIDACGGLALLRWHNRFVPQVLMYHRIIDAPFIAGLAPEEFEKQIAYLAKHFRIVSIETLIAEVQQNCVQPHTLAITFDDGHQDFYENAWPVLKKHRIPATLYVTTGFVSRDLWLWPDLLKYIILNANNKQIQIAPLGKISLAPEALSRSWHQLGDYCLTLDKEAREQFIRNLAELAAIALPTTPATPFLPVTWDQLRTMQSEGLDIGSHTISHPILKGLDATQLQEELVGSANDIQHQLQQRPTGICYPNGRLIDIDPNVLDQARQAGYEYGLLARNHPILPESPFLIGRLATHNDFDYFKWLLARHPAEQDQFYFG